MTESQPNLLSPSQKSQLAELEGEILKIFEDCKSQGMSRDEILQVFSPLGLSSMMEGRNKSTEGESTGIVNPDKQRKKDKPLSRRERVWRWIGSKINFRKILFLMMMVVGLGAFGAANEDKFKAARFHVLAVVRIGLIKILPYWNWTEMYYTRCLVKNPFFEAPDINVDDCNLCESLEEIVRVANLSQASVIDDFIRREKPFIATDAMEDWQIMKTDQFWFDNITEIYINLETYRVCNVNTNMRIPNGDFTRVLRRLYNPRTQEWFIHWENCQKELAKFVRQFYRRPYFISNSLDFTGSNWVIMSSDFRGRVYKKIEATDSLLMVYQIRGFNHIRLSPRDTCRGFCPELIQTLHEGEILVVTNLLWVLEYIPGDFGDNLAIISEVSWPSME